jgi:hypothetical protein
MQRFCYGAALFAYAMALSMLMLRFFFDAPPHFHAAVCRVDARRRCRAAMPCRPFILLYFFLRFHAAVNA